MKKLLFTATAVALVATQAVGWGRNAMLVPIEVAGACAANIGVSQPMRLSYMLVDGNFRMVQVEPGYGVSDVQSNRINACIANYAGFPVDKVKPLFGKERFVVRFDRCSTGVLVGGDSYCVKNAGY